MTKDVRELRLDCDGKRSKVALPSRFTGMLYCFFELDEHVCFLDRQAHVQFCCWVLEPLEQQRHTFCTKSRNLRPASRDHLQLEKRVLCMPGQLVTHPLAHAHAKHCPLPWPNVHKCRSIYICQSRHYTHALHLQPHCPLRGRAVFLFRSRGGKGVETS